MTGTTTTTATIRRMLVWLVLLAPSLLFTASAYNWECSLYCYNDGVCRHGKGKFGSFAGLDDETWDPEEATTPAVEPESALEVPIFNENQVAGQLVYGMYCSCPLGYTGLQCEIKLVVCGRNGHDQHNCFNGNDCGKEKTDSGLVYYRCECNGLESNLEAAYASKFCEHIATVFCGQKTHGSGTTTTSGSTSSNRFCTNGGKCVGAGDGEQMCECSEGWEGKHCETQSTTFIMAATDSSSSSMAAKKMGAGFVFLIILLVCCCGVGCTSWYRSRQQEKLRNSNYSTTKITKISSRKSKKTTTLAPPIELDNAIMA